MFMQKSNRTSSFTEEETFLLNLFYWTFKKDFPMSMAANPTLLVKNASTTQDVAILQIIFC